MRVPLIFSIFLLGCGAERVDWHADRRFTESEREAIVAGETWLAEHAGRSPATFDWTYEVTSDQPLKGTIRRELGAESSAGQCSDGTVYLGLENVVNPADIPGLAAHEMAHCELGFVDAYHAGEVPSEGIMRVLTPMRWTAAEEAQCLKHPDLCHR